MEEHGRPVVALLAAYTQVGRSQAALRTSLSRWRLPWIVGVALVPTPAVAVFFLLALGYSLKKRYRSLAAVSPLVNGGLKAALAAVVAPGAWIMIGLVYGVMA